MKIKLHEIPIRDIVDGYVNNNEEGVFGYHGQLNIRPPYQREFIYDRKERDAVIESVMKNFPLNVMYWIKNNDGTFGLMDGQQRTISICEYIIGNFSVEFDRRKYFHSLSDTEKEKILDYKLMIYFCEGTDRETLDWFKIVNIAGKKLTDQELRNAIYTGPWLSDAKRYFSKSNCQAYNIASKYMNGSPIRQDYLETTIKWISDGKIEEYMSKHQMKPNANELWLYFQNVISWVKTTFPTYRKEMKGIDWGYWFNSFKDKEFDTEQIENEVEKLMLDDDVTNKKGIYPYLLSRQEKYLNIRAFSPQQKREAYERQEGYCPVCNNYFDIDSMEADHITPWCEGGKTTAENCQMLCKRDNRLKSKK